MITFNGIELDLYKGGLKPLVLKKSLSGLQNLSDRKGTISTEFDLPRTPKNELAFQNISLDGAVSDLTGDAVCYIDGNVFATGKLYIKGVNDNSYSAIFIGSDLDFINEISKLPMSKLFNYDFVNVFTDAVIEPLLGSLATTANGVKYAYTHPHISHLGTDLTKHKLGVGFQQVDLLKLIIENQGLNLKSNILQNEYFEKVMISSFNGHKSCVIFAGATLTPTNYNNVGNIGDVVTGSGVTRTSNDYIIGRDVDKVEIELEIDYTAGSEVSTTQFYIDVLNGTDNRVEFTTVAYLNGGFLKEGKNFVKVTFEETIPTGWYINFRYLITPNVGFVNLPPYTGFSLVVSKALIKAGNAIEGDSCYIGDYLPNYTQLDYVKNFLKHYNLVMDVIGKDVVIELRDGGTLPNTVNTPTNGIASNTIDITDKVFKSNDVSIDYVQADAVFLKQQLIETDNTKYNEILQGQSFGSYVYDINTFRKNNQQTFESGFNTVYDSTDLLYTSFAYFFGTGIKFTITPIESWDNLAFHFVDLFDASIPIALNQTTTGTYYREHGTTASVQIFGHWGGLARMCYLWKNLFIGTLKKINQNRQKSVSLYDYTGSIVDVKNRYIIENQIYRLVDFEFDLNTKLVNAKMILDNG